MSNYLQKFRSYVGVGTQSVIGTSAPATHFAAIESCSLKEQRAGRQVLKLARASNTPYVMLPGVAEVTGNIVTPIIPDEATSGMLMAMLFGNYNTVSGSASIGYTHVFNINRTNTVDDTPVGSTIEVNLATENPVGMRDFIGMFINKMVLDIPEAESVKCTWDCVGIKKENGDTASVPTYSTKNPFLGVNKKIYIGNDLSNLTQITKIMSAQLTLDNKLKMMRGSGNGIYFSGRSYEDSWEGQVQLTNYFCSDDTTLYDVLDSYTEQALRIVVEHDQLAGSSSGAYKLQFDFPRVSFIGDQPTMGEQQHTVTAQLLTGQGADNYMAKCTIVNSQGGIYAV
jgi:hypothetical protein